MINSPLSFVYLMSKFVRPAGRLGSVPAWSRDSVGDKREGRRRPMLVSRAENIDMISATGKHDPKAGNSSG